MQMEMEEREDATGGSITTGGGGVGGVAYHWWWAAASTTQLGLGISSYRSGCSSHLMPFKAFAVASLFVGAIASAATSSLLASGIHSVEDMKMVGANIRTGLGVPPRRAQDK